MVRFGGFDEHLARAIVEAAVGGEADVFFLNGSVNVDTLNLSGLDGVSVKSGADGLLKEFLRAGVAGAAKPATMLEGSSGATCWK